MHWRALALLHPLSVARMARTCHFLLKSVLYLQDCAPAPLVCATEKNILSRPTESPNKYTRLHVADQQSAHTSAVEQLCACTASRNNYGLLGVVELAFFFGSTLSCLSLFSNNAVKGVVVAAMGFSLSGAC
jgi:hypothetical protein